ALDLVEGVRVVRAGNCRLRLGAKLLSAVEDKRCDVRPTREDGCAESRRNWPEVTGFVARNERRWGGGGTVVGAIGQQLDGDVLTDLDPALLGGTIRNRRQLTCEQLVGVGHQLGAEVRV